MLLLTRQALFILTTGLLALTPSAFARESPAAGAAIEIVKPEVGYVIEPRNPATYYKGDTNEMQFTLQGHHDLHGKVNVTLAKGKKRGIKIAKEIPVTNGEAEAPITIALWKFTSDTYTLKAILYNEEGKLGEATQEVEVKLPKKQKGDGKSDGQGDDQGDASVVGPSDTDTAEAGPEATASVDSESERKVRRTAFARVF